MSELFAQLGLDWKLVIAQAVNFLIVVFLLQKFVFSKLIKLMEERKERIEKGLQMREAAERELARTHEVRRIELAETRREAEAIVAQARNLSIEREKQLVAKARKEAEKMLYQAKADITRETEAALQEATEDIAQMALLAAEKILGRTITEEDRKRLTKEVMESLTT